MAKPVGTMKSAEKTDHRKKKNPSAHEEWQKRKREGRPKQVFVDTRLFNSIEEIEKLTDAQLLALPAPRWEKVSQ